MSQLNIFDFLDNDVSEQREKWTDYFAVKRLLERNGYMSEIMARTKAYENSRYTANSVYYYIYLAEKLLVRCVIVANSNSKSFIVDTQSCNTERIAAIMPVKYF